MDPVTLALARGYTDLVSVRQQPSEIGVNVKKPYPAQIVTLLGSRADDNPTSQSGVQVRRDNTIYWRHRTGWRFTLSTTGILTTTIWDFPAPYLQWPPAGIVGMWVYTPEPQKVDDITLVIVYPPPNDTQSWQFSMTYQRELKPGWNLLRRRANVSNLVGWGSARQLRVRVRVNAPTEIVVGHVFVECRPKAQMIFTADGGYANFYELGYPALRDLGVPVTWSLIPGEMDRGEPDKINEDDLAVLAEEDNYFSFHCWDSRGKHPSEMEPRELLTDTMKCIRWLSKRGLLHPKVVYKAGWLGTAGYPHHHITQQVLDCYRTPMANSGLEAFPFEDRYNIRMLILHSRTPEQIDEHFEVLKKTRGVWVPYTHKILENSTPDMDPENWAYFLQKVEDAINEGWYEGVTIADLYDGMTEADLMEALIYATREL